MAPKAKRGSRPAPLAGVRVLVTRARGQAEELSSWLRQQGARVREIPVIEIRPPRSWRPLDRALRRLENYDWLVLTSVNGVRVLQARMKKLKVTVDGRSQLKIAAIGPATRKAVERAGIRVAVTPKEYVAEALVRALRRQVRGKRVLLVRAAVARDILPRELRRAGAIVTVAAAYQTKVPAGARRRIGKLLMGPEAPQVVTCTSSSTVHNFLALSKGITGARKLAFASIGPVTSAVLRAYGIEPALEARPYTMQGLGRAMARWAAKQQRR